MQATTTTHAVIEFLRNGAGFETGGMKHHGHHAPVQAEKIKCKVARETGHRVVSLPPHLIVD